MSWRKYEKRKSRDRRGVPIGGPGEPDFIRGQTNGEVKAWNRRMGARARPKHMNKARLCEIDPGNDLVTWFQHIADLCD